MIRLWDGFLSVIAALLTAGIIGVPVWGSAMAVRAELIPVWGWGPLVLLAAAGLVMATAPNRSTVMVRMEPQTACRAAGLVMVLSFLRKAGRGVHPLRERRR